MKCKYRETEGGRNLIAGGSEKRVANRRKESAEQPPRGSFRLRNAAQSTGPAGFIHFKWIRARQTGNGFAVVAGLIDRCSKTGVEGEVDGWTGNRWRRLGSRSTSRSLSLKSARTRAEEGGSR